MVLTLFSSREPGGRIELPVDRCRQGGNRQIAKVLSLPSEVAP